MGVHYFYTWLTSRYPMIVQQHNFHKLPIIDYLYLDLNGVFYKCSQDSKGVFRETFNNKTRDQIFMDIVNYINFIVKLIKPRKQIFLAVDGVAPRAKMKDQRNRRHVRLKESEIDDDFLDNYVKIDPNKKNKKGISISAGSNFMEEVNKYIDFFIKRKLKEDPLWQDLKVQFSSSEVPGEGEHKIMDFIRSWKKSKQFDFNTTHCIYGNDSDLLLLALISHLPYIIVLRESFPPMTNKVISESMNRKEDYQKMEIIYINILKEYLTLEFGKYLGNLFDIERLVNDFVFFSYLIGNDFLPQIFCMNTKMGTYDQFLKILRHFYHKKKTYLTIKQKINQEGLMHLIKYLQHYEENLIETTLGDFLKKIKELRQSSVYKILVMKDVFDQNETHDESIIQDINFLTIEDFQQQIQKQQEELEIEEQEVTKVDINEEDILPIEKDENEIEILTKYEQDFIETYKKYIKVKKFLTNLLIVKRKDQNYKKIYYQKYFQTNQIDYKVCYQYIKGLNFIFQYYQIGCPSWDYIYPFNLPPLLSDLFIYLKKMNENGINLKFNFKNSIPCNPLIQQIIIHPKQNLIKLDQTIVDQIFNEKSTIKNMYPDDFSILPVDRSKQYTWHAKLPNLDEKLIDEFILNFNWEKIPENFQKLKNFGKIFNYKLDNTKNIHIKSLFENFESFDANINIEEIEPQFQPDKEIVQVSQEIIAPNIFPSTQVLKGLSLTKQMRHNREIVYFYLKNQTIKKFWEKINHSYKQIKMNKAQFPYRVYSNPIFNKLYLSYQVDKISPEELVQNKEYQNIFQTMLDNFKKQGILFEDPDYFLKLKNIPLYHIDKPVFANISYNLGDPKLNIKTIEDREEKKRLFLEISLKQQYSTCFGFPSYIGAQFKDQSICLNLETGDIVYMNKLNWNSNQHEGNLIKANKTIFNQVNRNMIREKYILITPKNLRQYFDLDLVQKDVFFLILDNYTILTDQKQSSCLMFGDGFSLGLQFIKVLNLPKQQWQCCNELVRFFPKPYDKDNQFDAYYESFDEQKGQELKYNIFLSKQGFKYVQDYFQENQFWINYFKQSSLENQLSQKTSNYQTKYKTLFKLTEIVGDKKEYDYNIELFNFYINQVQKPYSELKLRSCMSTFLDQNQVENIIKNLQQKNPKQNQALKSSDSFYLRYDPYYINVLPKMQFKPHYHRLGDRVIFIYNSSKNTNFGQLGTIIGIYKDKIEIIWDEPVIGGTNLNGRCPDFQGGVYQFFDVFNLTQWPKIVISQDYIREYEKCWEGDYDLRGLFEMAKTEESNFFKEKRYLKEPQLNQQNLKIFLFLKNKYLPKLKFI